MLHKSSFCLIRIAGRTINRNYSRIAVPEVSKNPETSAPQAPLKVNVDEKNVSLLGSLDQDWWDTNGSLKALHSLNLLRVPLVRDGLISLGSVQQDLIGTSNVLKGTKILEVGCGGGILTEALAKLKADLVAIDASDKLIEAAKSHAQNDKEISSKIDYRFQTIEEHTSGNQNKYDALVASEVLEHIQDQRSFLKACVETVKVCLSKQLEINFY